MSPSVTTAASGIAMSPRCGVDPAAVPVPAVLMRTFANMPGLSRREVFATLITTLAVRVTGSSASFVRTTRPMKVTLGYASTRTTAFAPARTAASERSGTSPTTLTVERSAMRKIGVPGSTAVPGSACTSRILPPKGATTGSMRLGSSPLTRRSMAASLAPSRRSRRRAAAASAAAPWASGVPASSAARREA